MYFYKNEIQEAIDFYSAYIGENEMYLDDEMTSRDSRDAIMEFTSAGIYLPDEFESPEDYILEEESFLEILEEFDLEELLRG